MSEKASNAAWEEDYEMKAEYDFSDSVSDPYAARFREPISDLLDASLRASFPKSEDS